MLISESIKTSEPFKLREDKYTLLFEPPKTNKDFLLSRFKAFNTAVKFFVFGESNVKSSITVIDFSEALIVKADFRSQTLYIFI